MGRYKCAYSCENSSDSSLRFFKFPLHDPRKVKKWLDNMEMGDWTPSRFSLLCSRHFEDRFIDRTGLSVTLKDDAVPTIFTPSKSTQKTKVSTKPRGRQKKKAAAKASVNVSAKDVAATPPRANLDRGQTEEPSGDPERWRIVADYTSMKIDSLPYFFHGNYCVPQLDIQWAPDENSDSKNKDPEKVIEVSEPWQWLSLDIRGPLPKTLNRNRYMLTVTDYYSKWVEAHPLDALLSEPVVQHIVEIINHFGYPLRFLSRLPQDLVQKINNDLKEKLKIDVALVIHHLQMSSTDVITEGMIDRMVNELIGEHPPDWDVYLPAKVFSLCFEEHSETKERPFSVLCCGKVEPVKSPRELNFTESAIQESSFVVR